MANNPLNLAARFLLEVAALVALGYWGFSQFGGVLQWLIGLGLPLLAMIAWGTLRVPGDSSNNGQAPVEVPGLVRLALEALMFGLAVGLLFAADQAGWAIGLAAALVIHYALSYDRVAWLLTQR